MSFVVFKLEGQDTMNSSKSFAGLALLTSCLAWSQVPTPVPDATTLNTTVRDNLSGHYRLTKDIYLNETDYILWEPIGSPQKPFNGILDGNNRLIYGLIVNTAEANCPTGLFSVLQDACIHHLAIINPEITSYGDNSPSGTLAGTAQGNTTIRHTMVINGQVVTWGGNSTAGLQLGEASGDSWIQQTLVTGQVQANGTSAAVGGLHGKLTDNARIEGALSATNVTTHGQFTSAGNLLGSASDNASVEHTLSIGHVTTHGKFTHAGSHLGSAHDNTLIKKALAAGSVRTDREGINDVQCCNYRCKVHTGRECTWLRGPKCRSSPTECTGSWSGGFMGSTSASSRIEQTLTTSTVTTNGPALPMRAGVSRTGSQLGELSPDAQWDQNLSTGNVTVNVDENSVGIIVGDDKTNQTFNNVHVIGHVESPHGSENTRQLTYINKTSLPPGLDPLLWTLGNDNQYPILTGINPAWQDLRRIDGTLGGHNRFPPALTQLAEPGSSYESLFDRAHWHVRDGYLPFLKGVGQERAEQAWLDCGPGGFACTATICEAPLGLPGFQTFDPATGYLYVVAHQPETHRLLLVRYNADTTLDETFGDCGQLSWPAYGLSPSFQVTSGIYHDGHIYLATDNDDRVTLVSLGISPTSYRTEEGDPGVRIDAMVFDQRLYYTGTSGGDLLLGESASLNLFRTDGQPNVQEAGYALLAQNNSLYVTGHAGNHSAIWVYDLERQPVSYSGDSGAVTDTFMENSLGQALALLNGMLYVAGSVKGENDVYIRRYDPNGQRDDSFEVLQDSGIDDPQARTLLAVIGDDLILLKQDSTADQVIVRVFDRKGQETSRQRLLTPQFTGNAIARGLAFDPATQRAYFVGRNSSGALAVKSLDTQRTVHPTLSIPEMSSTGEPGMSPLSIPEMSSTGEPGMSPTPMDQPGYTSAGLSVTAGTGLVTLTDVVAMVVVGVVTALQSM